MNSLCGRLVALFLIVVFILPAAAEETEPIPYDPSEFSPVLRGVRRGEILFFGSIPITFLVAGLGWELGKAAAGSSYPYSDEQHPYNVLFTAGALSLGIVLLDLVLGLLEE